MIESKRLYWRKQLEQQSVSQPFFAAEPVEDDPTMYAMTLCGHHEFATFVRRMDEQPDKPYELAEHFIELMQDVPNLLKDRERLAEAEKRLEGSKNEIAMLRAERDQYRVGMKSLMKAQELAQVVASNEIGFKPAAADSVNRVLHALKGGK